MKKALELGWKMKDLSTAKTQFNVDRHGVYRLHIEHQVISGVTPEMLFWWFTHIDGTICYKGNIYPRYRIWHPYDHVDWKLARNDRRDGSIGPGSYFQIIEYFGRNKKFGVNSIERVEKLDETGIRLVIRKFGILLFSLEHWFYPAGHDSSYYRSHLIVGTNHVIGRILYNRIIRPFIFTKAMGHAWLKHNVEEVGNFEFFLSELYASEREIG